MLKAEAAARVAKYRAAVTPRNIDRGALQPT
jgi:hypothetical protein